MEGNAVISDDVRRQVIAETMESDIAAANHGFPQCVRETLEEAELRTDPTEEVELPRSPVEVACDRIEELERMLDVHVGANDELRKTVLRLSEGQGVLASVGASVVKYSRILVPAIKGAEAESFANDDTSSGFALKELRELVLRLVKHAESPLLCSCGKPAQPDTAIMGQALCESCFAPAAARAAARSRVR